MRLSTITITVLLILITLNGFSINNEQDKPQKKATTQYEFNLFKLFTVTSNNHTRTFDTTCVKPIINTTVRRKEND